MSNAKHTKGTWLVHQGVDYIKVYVERKKGADKDICAVRYTEQEDHANFDLIAAAPDMAEALKLIETICTESASDCRKRMGTRIGNCIAVARAALAKAGAA